MEHLLLMAPSQADIEPASPQSFLERLAQLAQQTPAMALQVGFGCVMWHSGANSLKVLTQFPDTMCINLDRRDARPSKTVQTFQTNCSDTLQTLLTDYEPHE